MNSRIRHTVPREKAKLLFVALLMVLSLLLALATAAHAGNKVYYYVLGEKNYIEKLYPQKGTNGYPLRTTEIIRDFLEQSLKADRIPYISARAGTISLSQKIAYYTVTITVDGSDPASKAAEYYKKIQTSILSRKIAGQALKGVSDCKAAGDDCWNPLSGFGDPPFKWDMFLPLGLPMVNQKIIMLLHYPPYVSLQDHNYLNNATMQRWERMLKSAGVPESDYTLYESIVDINPIAAPGSGQSAYFPALMSTYLFDSAVNRRRYITPMLTALADPPSNTSATNTRPVIVFGAQAQGYWTVRYKDQLQPDKKKTPYFGVLSAGSLQLNSGGQKSKPRGGAKQTPYLGANHPIAAVYSNCASSPSIVTMEKQDLTTACYAKTFGDDPNANWQTAIDTCKNTWNAATPAPAQQSIICINARLDMNKSPTWQDAQAWCAANDNNPCPSTAQSGPPLAENPTAAGNQPPGL